MKHSVRVMSLLMALSGAIVPAALAQTTPPAQTPPAQTAPTTSAPTETQHHPKASGAAKGAAIGAMGERCQGRGGRRGP